MPVLRELDGSIHWEQLDPHKETLSLRCQGREIFQIIRVQQLDGSFNCQKAYRLFPSLIDNSKVISLITFLERLLIRPESQESEPLIRVFERISQ